MTDISYLNERGAKKLARKIEDYWKKRGYYGIETWVIDQVCNAKSGPETFYFVRTNIGANGFPPKGHEQAA